MVAKLYFEETFSVATAQALQTWANDNLITPTFGDYAMTIAYVDNGALLMYAETEFAGLTVDDSYTVRMYINNITSNAFRIFINALPNDNSSAILQEGWISTPAWKEFSFIATATTMYLAIGDDDPALTTTSTVDNVTVKDGQGTNYVTNSTFEGNDTTGWYGQSVNTELSIYQYAVEPPVEGDNPYLEPINLPIYNPDDPTHVVVSLSPTGDEEAYVSDTFNNSSYQHFFILPGNYRTRAFIEINSASSGSAISRKSVQLLKSYGDTSQDQHPAQLDDSENCFVQFKNRADYWTFDRMRLDGTNSDNRIILKASENNIVNRLYATDITQACVTITGKSHYSTVQNSRFVYANDKDTIAVNIKVSGDYDYKDGNNQYYSALHCKVVRNEFVDCGDGFQASAGAFRANGYYTYGNVGGLVLDDNDFYLEDQVDKENATDTKCGSPSLDPDNFLSSNGYPNPYYPCQISNNRAWGYNSTVVGSGDSAIIASMYSNGWKIFNNVTFDCIIGLAGGSNSADMGSTVGYEDSEVYNNIIYDCGSSGHVDDGLNQPFRYSNSRNQKIYGNYFIQPRSERIARFRDMDGDCTFSTNNIVDPLNDTWTIFNDPAYPSNQAFIDSQISNAEMSRVGFTDYTFYKDKFTNTPTPITLPEILDPNGTIVSPV